MFWKPNIFKSSHVLDTVELQPSMASEAFSLSKRCDGETF